MWERDSWWIRCDSSHDLHAIRGRVQTAHHIVQDLASAEKFYDSKVSELTNNLKDLETIVQRKQMNARTIEEGRDTPST
jgi:hypothetical protein